MKNKFPFLYTISILTTLLNFLLIIFISFAPNIDINLKDDLSITTLALLFFSSSTLYQCYCLYNNNILNGDKSVKKLIKIILLLTWVNLLIDILALFEHKNVEQIPFTNFPLVIAWIGITILCLFIYKLELNHRNTL